ncbi:MAG: DUF4136 domain-containing protein [Bacteroidetes bacterium]|nr:MAG: DUF4136 domain-containing protein [Bacteroidota bacterium]
MNRLYFSLVALSFILMAGCGSSVRVFSDISDNGNFEQYGTYTFLDFTDGNKKTVPGMELERIRVAVARELEKRGLKFAETGADISVQVTVYHREARNYSFHYPGSYNYMERAIAVDMYENANRNHIWHAAAVGELVYDPERRAERLPEVVARIFEKYPVPGDSPA